MNHLIFSYKHEEGERASTLVEFAFILPVLVLVLVGLIECCLTHNKKHTLSVVAREAAVSAFRACPFNSDPAPCLSAVVNQVASANSGSVVESAQIILSLYESSELDGSAQLVGEAVSNGGPFTTRYSSERVTEEYGEVLNYWNFLVVAEVAIENPEGTHFVGAEIYESTVL